MIKGLILLGILTVLSSCVSKSPPTKLNKSKAVVQVRVIVSPGSLSFTVDEVASIIRRTNKFCKMKGNKGVIQIRIFKKMIEGSPAKDVKYTCYG